MQKIYYKQSPHHPNLVACVEIRMNRDSKCYKPLARARDREQQIGSKPLKATINPRKNGANCKEGTSIYKSELRR